MVYWAEETVTYIRTGYAFHKEKIDEHTRQRRLPRSASPPRSIVSIKRASRSTHPRLLPFSAAVSTTHFS